VFFLYLYACGANLQADPYRREEETRLLSLLDDETKAEYFRLLEKHRFHRFFTPEFSQVIKYKKPDPLLGYAREAFNYNTANMPACLFKTERREISQFEVRLHQLFTVKSITGNIDMIAAGHDPSQESHRHNYRGIIANSDINCGERIRQAAADYFFTRQSPSSPESPAADKQRRQSKKHNKRLIVT
ncbi:MAG: hypothetical protein LBJ14_03065, partial [Desulfarculales bacterium]|jgi:hypothetical protein|nr:hypothetical protein [Desulfarculales bacterium]